MHPLEAFLFAVFLSVFFGSILLGVFSALKDAFFSHRMKRLEDIQQQWRSIDYHTARTNDLAGKGQNWRATSMTWSLRKDGWKGWGRDWVDD